MEMKDQVGTYDSILPVKDDPREDRVGSYVLDGNDNKDD